MATIDVKVPDIGDFKDVPVIELLVQPGDTLKPEDPMITLESDKATMEVPAPAGGKIVEILLKVGDKVSEGTAILKLETGAAETPAVEAIQAPKKANGQGVDLPPPEPPQPSPEHARKTLPPPLGVSFANVHAGPSVRRLARELDIDLTRLTGTGEKGRITIADVKSALKGPATGLAGGSGIPEIPPQDFSKFGPIEEKPLSRMRRISGPHLHRSWLNIPHVTHTDEADITDVEAYRKSLDAESKEKGYRVTLLAFLIKASVSALKHFPEFNSSLSPSKDSLILKHYYNIGVAVDTPDGLVVPVIKEADRKGITELSQELGTVSKKMREGKVTPGDISGGSFSISSLGGIGGTNFTPIVNAPEVAILGVVRSTMKPVWDGKAFQPRLMLPLCVSYDHRVIDGALAARFTRYLATVLEDIRQLLL